jgi:hypothetical protein
MEEKFIFFLVHIGWNKVTIKLKKKKKKSIDHRVKYQKNT